MHLQGEIFLLNKVAIFFCRLEALDPTCVTLRCAARAFLVLTQGGLSLFLMLGYVWEKDALRVAHSFQLLLTDLSETPLVRNSMATLNRVLEFTEDPEIQKTLKELQRSAGRGEGKIPIKPVETRCSRAMCLTLPHNFQVVKQHLCNGGDP